MLRLSGTDCNTNKAAAKHKGQSLRRWQSRLRSSAPWGSGRPAGQLPCSRGPNAAPASRPGRPLCGDWPFLRCMWELGYVEELSFRLKIALRSPGPPPVDTATLGKSAVLQPRDRGQSLPSSEAAFSLLGSCTRTAAGTQVTQSGLRNARGNEGGNRRCVFQTRWNRSEQAHLRLL